MRRKAILVLYDEANGLKADQSLNLISRLQPYPYANIPKETLTLKCHNIDQLSVIAAFLAHPYLDMPDKYLVLRQDQLNSLYSFLQDNKVTLYTLNFCLSSKPHLWKKTTLIRKLIESHPAFSENYELAFKLKQEVLNIVKNITENGDELVFIKALSDIPLDSNNFDVLVKKQNLENAENILKNLGFVELEKFREHKWGGGPFKFLYRRLYNGIVMSIHLHTGVAWEGVKFIEDEQLWNGTVETKIDNVKLGFPSPENHLLITVAHAFFENKSLKLSDLMFMAEDLQHEHEMNWDYVAESTFHGGWFKPFHATLRLANHLYESLFKRKLVKEEVFVRLAQKVGIYQSSSLEKDLIASFEKEPTIPFSIPNNKIIMAFVKKVFADPDFSFIQKSKKIFSTSWSYVRRRTRRELPTFLVCFSGQDGSGKTKHSKSLRRELEQRNISSDYVWSRGFSFSMAPFLGIGRLLILNSKYSETREYVRKRGVLLQKEPIKTLWTSAIVADEMLLSLFKVRTALSSGRVVICDRYIPDILVDARCELGKEINWAIVKCIKKLTPKPKIHFVLDAKPEEILKRRKDADPKLIRCKRNHCLAYSYESDRRLIDTGMTFEQNKEDILTSFMKVRYLGNL